MFIEVRITSPVWLCLRTVFCISTRVLLVNISLPVEPQRNMSTCMRQKTSLSRHILCWSSTCVFIIFHSDPNMWPSCWRGRANRKDIVKTYNIKTAEGHNGFASQQFSLPFFFFLLLLQLPGAALRPRYSHVHEEWELFVDHKWFIQRCLIAVFWLITNFICGITGRPGATGNPRTPRAEGNVISEVCKSFLGLLSCSGLSCTGALLLMWKNVLFFSCCCPNEEKNNSSL